MQEIRGIIACELTNLIQVLKNVIIAYFHLVPSQLILKDAKKLSVLIHYIVNMKYFDYILSILQNFKKQFETEYIQKYTSNTIQDVT